MTANPRMKTDAQGYSEALRQYQGEVLQKTCIHSAFYVKLARCKKDPTALEGTDWAGLRGILEGIFCAFD